MKIWTEEEAKDWYVKQPWLVGCNFLPSSAINQLEMFQSDTFDEPTLTREIKWASELGFNTLRIYLHDLLWKDSSREFCETLDTVLENKINFVMKIALLNQSRFMEELNVMARI